MLNTTRTATPTALNLIRDPDVTVEQLARHFGESEAFAAGLTDAVTGDIDWRHVWRMDEAVPSKAEQADYENGFRTAEAMLDVERTAAGWTDCYATAAVEARQAAELVPVCCDDCPF